jgi:hypothetical protein
VRWSSDSLSRELRLQGATITLQDSVTLAAIFSPIDPFAVLQVVLPNPERRYRLRVGLLGVRPADTTIVLRQGYTDTAMIFLQASGVGC